MYTVDEWIYRGILCETLCAPNNFYISFIVLDKERVVVRHGFFKDKDEAMAETRKEADTYIDLLDPMLS